jgi:hypothetical protein
LGKLAAQFDRELSDRDRAIKGLQQTTQGEIHKAFGTTQMEIENIRKQISDIEVRKADKRELTDFKLKLNLQVE